MTTTTPSLAQVRSPRLPLDQLVQERVREFLLEWPAVVHLENLDATRSYCESLFAGSASEHCQNQPLHGRDLKIPGRAGADAVTVSVYTPVAQGQRSAPLLVYIHSGGLVLGNRFNEEFRLLDLAAALGAVVVSVEYRLAPEHPYPAAIEDCYTGLTWAAANAEDLHADPTRIVLIGESAGGGLAASLAHLVRDRSGPPLLGQMLLAPMLDHRNNARSVDQMDGVGLWDKQSNEFGWTAYLGPVEARVNVPASASAAMATNMAQLPAAFIDVADSEIFRDEAVAYASALWGAGVPAELHVWTGGCHVFYSLLADQTLAETVFTTRREWLSRLLEGGRPPAAADGRPRPA